MGRVLGKLRVNSPAAAKVVGQFASTSRAFWTVPSGRVTARVWNPCLVMAVTAETLPLPRYRPAAAAQGAVQGAPAQFAQSPAAFRAPPNVSHQPGSGSWRVE